MGVAGVEGLRKAAKIKGLAESENVSRPAFHRQNRNDVRTPEGPLLLRLAPPLPRLLRIRRLPQLRHHLDSVQHACNRQADEQGAPVGANQGVNPLTGPLRKSYRHGRLQSQRRASHAHRTNRHRNCHQPPANRDMAVNTTSLMPPISDANYLINRQNPAGTRHGKKYTFG